MNVLYYMYLLFIVIFLLILLKKSICIYAIKARIYIQICLFMFFLRYIVLVIFRISKGTWHLYLLKPYIFINALGIISLSILFLYIFLKNNNIDFKYNYVFMLAFTGSYITLYKFLKPKIIYDINFGYIVTDLSNSVNVFLAYLIALSVFVIIAIVNIDKRNADSNRLFIFIITISLIILENIMYLGGIKVIPYVMFTDILMLLLTFNVINKLNKRDKYSNCNEKLD